MVLITILTTDSHSVSAYACNEKSHQISRYFSNGWDDQLHDFLMGNKSLSVQTEKLNN